MPAARGAQGKVVVRAGTEGFQSEQGPWSYLGAKALGGGGKAGAYVPDFDAVTAGSCRLLRITADAYAAALRMGRAAEGRAADQIVGVRAVKQARSALHALQGSPERAQLKPVACKVLGLICTLWDCAVWYACYRRPVLFATTCAAVASSLVLGVTPVLRRA